MSSYTYQRAPGHCGKAFSAAVTAALPGMNFKVACGGATVISFISGLTSDQENDLDQLVAGFSDLVEAKEVRHSHVKERTADLLATGFEYPAASGVFWEHDQYDQNMHKAWTFGGHAAFASAYPISWSNIDDTVSQSFADYAELQPFVLTGMASELGIKLGANTIHQGIRDATTQAELDLVIDTR